MGKILPVREVLAPTCSCFANLIFMSFCFAVSTHYIRYKGQNVNDSLLPDLYLQK